MNKLLFPILFGFFSLVSKPIYADSVNNKEQIKVGAILSLTGDLAPFGKGIQQGIELALSEGNSSEFKVIFEDDQSLNRIAAVNATKKLISIEKVSVVLNMVVNTVTALSSILNQAKTVGLVIWDSNKTIGSLGEYVFGLGYSTELAGEDLAQFAYAKLAVKNLAIISAHDEWSEIISTSFSEKFKSLGGQITFHENVNINNSDFKTLITKARENNVQAIYGPLFATGLVSWIKQSRELGFKGYLLTGDGFSDNEIQQAGEANTDGIYLTQVWVEDKDFKRRYKEKFGQDASGLNIGFVAMGYDSIKCLSQAKREIEARQLIFNSETLKDHLKLFTCSGVTGKTQLNESRISDKREAILVVKDGGFQPVR